MRDGHGACDSDHASPAGGRAGSAGGRGSGNAGDRGRRVRFAQEADAEAQGKKTAEGEAIEGAEEEVELEDEGMDDAAFIEEQEEGDEDVTDIIGDVDDEEET